MTASRLARARYATRGPSRYHIGRTRAPKMQPVILTVRKLSSSIFPPSLSLLVNPSPLYASHKAASYRRAVASCSHIYIQHLARCLLTVQNSPEENVEIARALYAPTPGNYHIFMRLVRLYSFFRVLRLRFFSRGRLLLFPAPSISLFRVLPCAGMCERGSCKVIFFFVCCWERSESNKHFPV